MRMLLEFQFPLEPFNTYIKDGTAGAKIGHVLDEIKPEHVYFTEHDGRRGGIAIVEVATASDIPRLAEPFFLIFHAQVEFRIAMTPEDLAKAHLDVLAKEWI
jgi:hypothetical protein